MLIGIVVAAVVSAIMVMKAIPLTVQNVHNRLVIPVMSWTILAVAVITVLMSVHIIHPAVCAIVPGTIVTLYPDMVPVMSGILVLVSVAVRRVRMIAEGTATQQVVLVIVHGAIAILLWGRPVMSGMRVSVAVLRVRMIAEGTAT